MAMDLYKKYYLDEANILDIINQGIVVFDTSALLDIYYYSDEAQRQIFNNAFCGLKDRLWIPAQCYFEFLKNKDKVLEKPYKTYEALLDSENKDKGYVPKIVSKANSFGKKEITELKGLLKTLRETTTTKDKHPYLNQEIFASLDRTFDELETQISSFSKAVTQFEADIDKEINEKIAELQIKTDDVQQFIEVNFEIGKELSYERMLAISEEGRERFSEKIPPGYEDAKTKSGMQKYGDLFAWKEILSMAKDRKKDVLFVINDVKDDWWDKEQKAPCFELLKEFQAITGKQFWSCTMKEFLYRVNKRNDKTNQIMESVIEEVDDVTRQMFEDSLKLEIDGLCAGVLGFWLDSETEYILGNRHDILPEWRVFGTCYLYDAINYRGDEALVMMNFLNKTNHASILHAFTNLLEVKRYFDNLGKEYQYRQVVVAKSRESAERIYDQIQANSSLSKIYYKKGIENDLVYLRDGQLLYVNSNHPMG